jgi:hypothetical protein
MRTYIHIDRFTCNGGGVEALAPEIERGIKNRVLEDVEKTVRTAWERNPFPILLTAFHSADTEPFI